MKVYNLYGNVITNQAITYIVLYGINGVQLPAWITVKNRTNTKIFILYDQLLVVVQSGLALRRLAY